MVNLVAGHFQVSATPVAAPILGVPFRLVVVMQRPFMNPWPFGVSPFLAWFRIGLEHLRIYGPHLRQAFSNFLFMLTFVPLHANHKFPLFFFRCFHVVFPASWRKCCGDFACVGAFLQEESCVNRNILHLAYGSRWHETGKAYSMASMMDQRWRA